MNKYDELYEEMSHSILNKLRKNLPDDKVKYVCPKCGFKVPKYRGKYPRYCQLCGDIVDMNKYKLTKSWSQSGLHVDMDPFGDKIEPNDIEFNDHLNTGMKNGLLRGLDDSQVKSKCDECGFKMPKYAGRYPRYCPKCGKDNKVNNPEVEITRGGIDLKNPNNPVMEMTIEQYAQKMNVLIAEENAERFLKNEDDLAVAKQLAIKGKKGDAKSQKKLSEMLQNEDDYASFIRELGL